MKPIRISCVRYLNTLPLVDGLDKVDGVQITPTSPALIAGRVRDGQADLGLASIIDAARSDLALVPVGMIGSDGPTLTVRLFSRRPLETIEQVHADVESHTSTALCAILLDRLFGVRPAFVDFDAREGIERTAQGASDRPIDEQAHPDAMLLIGDKVATDAPAGYEHQLDLGLAWRELTGQPMVYAMWMCRPEAMEDDAVRLGAALLDRQRRHNAGRLDWIVTRCAASFGWDVSQARRYVRELLRYEVGPRELAAVETFLRAASDMGLAPDRAVQVLSAPATV